MIRNRIKSIRHRFEIDTQKEFAKIVGVSPSKVSIWESQKEQPILETAFKIVDKLNAKFDVNLKVDDLFEYTPE